MRGFFPALCSALPFGHSAPLYLSGTLLRSTFTALDLLAQNAGVLALSPTYWSGNHDYLRDVWPEVSEEVTELISA